MTIPKNYNQFYETELGKIVTVGDKHCRIQLGYNQVLVDLLRVRKRTLPYEYKSGFIDWIRNFFSNKVTFSGAFYHTIYYPQWLVNLVMFND